MDFFGPRPNSALVELAQTARADADRSDYGQLRLTQSEELFAEVNRICGVEDTGDVPDTCTIDDKDPAAPSKSPEEAVKLLVELMDKAPEESRPLLAHQAIQLARGNEALPDNPDENTLAQARELLEFEYATIYGLDVAQTYGVDVDTDVHAELTLELRELVGDDAPVSEASYSAEWPDDSSAKEFAKELVQSSRDNFEAAAATAKDPQWRSWLIHAAAKL